MNFIVLLSLLSLFSFSGPELSFLDNRLVNYGDIAEGEKAVIEISYKNTGDNTLILYDHFPSCNCTSISYNKSTNPGETGKFVLNIDTTGKFGTETVVVKVLANTSDEYYILRVDMNIVDNHDSKKHKKTL